MSAVKSSCRTRRRPLTNQLVTCISMTSTKMIVMTIMMRGLITKIASSEPMMATAVGFMPYYEHR